MSWQKGTSFSKYSNLEAKKVVHFINFGIKDIKVELLSPIKKKQSFLDGFYASENQN